MKGSTYGLVTLPPTDNEPRELQRILIPDEFEWDPSNNLFGISSQEEEYIKGSNFY